MQMNEKLPVEENEYQANQSRLMFNGLFSMGFYAKFDQYEPLQLLEMMIEKDEIKPTYDLCCYLLKYYGKKDDVQSVIQLIKIMNHESLQFTMNTTKFIEDMRRLHIVLEAIEDGL
jgi:hypothetical protein